LGRGGRGERGERGREAAPATEWLYGRNAVMEALRARRRSLRRLVVASGAREAGLRGLIEEADRANLTPAEQPREQLDRLVQGANHQGVLLEVGPYPYADPDDLLAVERDSGPLYLLLDQLQDPQNVGTLLRSAEAIGVTGVLIPEHRAATITPAVANASAGATEWLQIARVTNLTRTIGQLKERGVWVAGLEGVPEAKPINDADLRGGLAIVVGSEGGGISRLVRESCDFLIRLPMRGQIGSLNAAVAGSLALYAADRQRHANDE
jgi:23S rRNA (guanosine2251-2'-O)-methyltransferase